MASIFALVDCNNFYASCERVFNPALEGRPVVVLSNNDGCIIARSEEAKELGIRMGTPLFKAQQVIRAHGIHVFSSNYDLYGDMSGRVMRTLGEFTPEVEVYSIDEAFLNLTGHAGGDLTDLGRTIRSIVRQWTGIPVSIGIAPTKALAKVANHFVKKTRWAEGVFDITSRTDLDDLLLHVPIEDVWGIGWRLSKMLKGRGLRSALDFRNMPAGWVRKTMGVTGLRLHQELHGIPCFTLESAPAPRRAVTVSRSFSRPIETLAELGEAIATFTSAAARKLRHRNLAARGIVVYIDTSRYGGERYFRSHFQELPVGTDDTPELLDMALRELRTIFLEGYRYKRAGVVMTDLIPVTQVQTELFDGRDRERSRVLMGIMDEANRRMGAETIRYAATGGERSWKGRSARRSPRYTTRWDEIPVISI